MQLKDAMLDQLAVARRIVTDGHQVVPAWRIRCTDGDWLVLSRFDHDKPGQRDRAVTLMKRFMAWKLAQSFILTTDWIGSVELAPARKRLPRWACRALNAWASCRSFAEMARCGLSHRYGYR